MSRNIVHVNPRASKRLEDNEKYGPRPRPQSRNQSPWSYSSRYNSSRFTGREQSPRTKVDKKSNVLLRANRACDASPARNLIPARNITGAAVQPKNDEYKKQLLEQYGLETEKDVPSRPPKSKSSGKGSKDRPDEGTQSTPIGTSEISTWKPVVESPDDLDLQVYLAKKKEIEGFLKVNSSANEEKAPSVAKSESVNKNVVDKANSVEKEESVKNETCADSSQGSDGYWKNEDSNPLSKFLRRKPQLKEVSVQLEPEPEPQRIKSVPHHTADRKPSSIYISQIPTIKFIAEKFARYKKDYVELRRLSEKIVCVEYDIYDQEEYKAGIAKPIKKMRAYFSIKPPCLHNERGDEENVPPLSEIPSVIKDKYNIAEEDLKKLTEKEIEMIDETILENREYLDDLKKILNRKQDSKNKNVNLDLQYLYEMAQREHPPSDYDFSNLLTKSELGEVKDLILKRCVSSVHGISRRILKRDDENDNNIEHTDAVSKNTIAELINRIS